MGDKPSRLSRLSIALIVVLSLTAAAGGAAATPTPVSDDSTPSDDSQTTSEEPASTAADDEPTATDAPTAEQTTAEPTAESEQTTAEPAAEDERTTAEPSSDDSSTPEPTAATETHETSETDASADFEVEAEADGSAKIGEAVQFGASVSGADGDVSYDWEFGDGGFDSGRAVEHAYVEPGTHEATVTATDAGGAEATDTVSVTVERSFADAPTLDPGSSVTPPTADNSVYAIEASEGQSIGVVTSGADDGWVGLYAPSGELVDSIDLATPDSTMFGVTATESGTYHVAEKSDMVLELELQMGGPDEFESNQERSSAAEPGGDALAATLTEADTTDWYAVEAGSGTLDASLELTQYATNQGDAAIRIYDDDGNRIGTEDERTSRTIANGVDWKPEAEQRAQLDGSGTYYVQIVEPSGDEPFTAVDGFTGYELSIDAPAPATNDGPGSTATPGPGGSNSTATPESGGSSATETPDSGGSGATETPNPTATPDAGGDSGGADTGDTGGDSTDSISVSVGDDRTAAIGEALRFQADAAGANDDVSYEWTVRRGDARLGHDTGTTTTHEFNASGDYRVTVTAADGGAEATDSVNVTADGEFGEVPTLASGESMSGEGSIAFGVEAEAGQSIGVAVDSGMEGNATLYDPSGEVVQRVSLHTDSRLFGAVASESGTYRVTLASPGFPSATVHVRDPDEFEPNQNATAATDLAVDENVTATLTEDDSADWYAVEVGAGDVAAEVNLSTLAVNQGDVSLQIYDADLRPVGRVGPNDTTGETNRTFANGAYSRYAATQRASVDEPGVYYVRVSEASGDDYAFSDVDGFTEYTLSLNAPTPADDSTAPETATPEPTDEDALSGGWLDGLGFGDLFALFGNPFE